MFDCEPFLPCLTQEQQQAYLDSLCDAPRSAGWIAATLVIVSLVLLAFAA